VLELLLQQVGSNGTQVPGQQFPQSDALLAGEVALAFEQDPAGLRQCDVLSFGPESADLLASSLVNGLAQERHDMEAIENMHCATTASADNVDEGRPHVARHELDAPGALVAEH